MSPSNTGGPSKSLQNQRTPACPSRQDNTAPTSLRSKLPSKFGSTFARTSDRNSLQRLSKLFPTFVSSGDRPTSVSRTEAIRAVVSVGTGTGNITREADSRFSFLEHPSAPRRLTSVLRGASSSPSSTRRLKASPSTPVKSPSSIGTPYGSPSRQNMRGLLPRLWDALASPLRPDWSSSGLGRDRFTRSDNAQPQPLDGDEGELIIDEGFSDSYHEGRQRLDIVTLLPSEIALHLLLFLDLPSIISSLRVSRYWNSVVNDPLVWRTLFYSRTGWQIDTNVVRRRLNSLSRLETYISEEGDLDLSLSTSLPIARLMSVASSGDSSHESGPISPRISPGASYMASSLSPALSCRDLPPLSLGWKDLFKTRYILERRWRSSAPKVTKVVGHSDSVYCVQFDSDRIVTGSRDRTIRIWNAKSGKLRKTLRGHQGSVLCLQYDSATSFMLSGSSDSNIFVWDLDKGVLNEKIPGHKDGVLDLCFDENWIVSCGKDYAIRVWHRHTHAPHLVLTGHDGAVNGVGLQGKHIVSASGDGKVKMWDIETGHMLRQFEGHNRGVASIALTSDFVISGSNDNQVKVYDVATGDCLRTFVGHKDLVRTLAVDPCSGRIVSGSYDRSVRVWDMHGDEKAVRVFDKLHDTVILDVAFNCSKIITASYGHAITILDFGYDLDTSLFL